jgi:hypothetical protein
MTNGKKMLCKQYGVLLGSIGWVMLLAACAPAVVRYNEAGNERFAQGAFRDAADQYGQAQVAAPDVAEP